jgi:uncharacterized membrane protein
VQSAKRSGWQVLCNSCWALAAVVLWNVTYAPSSVHAQIFNSIVSPLPSSSAYNREKWCSVEPTRGNAYSRALVMAVLGHFACCLGDTLASELGILARHPPRLLLVGKKVPPGTNGGMTIWGTWCSVVGGAVMGLVMGLSLVLENPACRHAAGGSGVTHVGMFIWKLIGWGGFGGGFGSLVDSVLGASVQKTRYDENKKMILQDGNSGGTGINGVDLLTNNQVNLVSSLVAAGVLAWMTSSI